MAIKIFDVAQPGVDMIAPSAEKPGAMTSGSVARAVIWPGMGASGGVMHYVRYQAGGTSVQHQHPHSEDIGYIIEGEGYIFEWKDGKQVAKHAFRAGNMLYVEPGTVHSHEATTDLVMVGGPCPPDDAFYRNLGLRW
jgi:quercetin dioxygenase-like cupin family protein